MTLRVLIAGAVVAAFAVGCSAAADDAPHVEPFENITTSDPDVTVDSSGTFASVQVSTSIDAVCAVAFGEDSELGGLATDIDMGGGGHQTHEARLAGLAPGTEYFYRLQGVGPDGTLYQGDLMTFTTPEGPGVESLGRNIADTARVVAVSSEFSDRFVAENALDGDVSTEWSSLGDGNDAFVVLDFGDPITVSSVRFLTRTMSDGSATTTTFAVVVDDDGRYGPFDADSIVADIDLTGRRFRFEVETSTGGNTGAVEIEVYTTVP